MVAKVVKAKFLPSHQPSQPGHTLGNSPVMLETTAAVHPGGSGGAVVNSDGHMIGLVTRYAKYLSLQCLFMMVNFQKSRTMKLPLNILISQ